MVRDRLTVRARVRVRVRVGVQLRAVRQQQRAAQLRAERGTGHAIGLGFRRLCVEPGWN